MPMRFAPDAGAASQTPDMNHGRALEEPKDAFAQLQLPDVARAAM